METKQKTSLIAEILKSKAPFGFIPNEEFYNKINVKRKKWAMLVRGEREPTISELRNICSFFQVDIKNYI